MLAQSDHGLGTILEKPVFYDASGNRQKWSTRGLALVLGLIVAAAIGFAITVVSVPTPRALYPLGERVQAQPLAVQIAQLRNRLTAWLPAHRLGAAGVDQVAVGFYVPWADDSKVSLTHHIGELDWVVPALAHIADAGKTVTYTPDLKFDAIIANASHRPKVLPMIQNAKNDKWDGTGMAAILRDPARRKAMLDWATRLVIRQKGAGIVFDFEELPASAQGDYLRFLTEARAQFAPRGWLVTLTLPVDDPALNLGAFGRAADRVFLMNYDENAPGGDADPGPIASQQWFVEIGRAHV